MTLNEVKIQFQLSIKIYIPLRMGGFTVKGVQYEVETSNLRGQLMYYEVTMHYFNPYASL
jgi:hypothetical protein